MERTTIVYALESYVYFCLFVCLSMTWQQYLPLFSGCLSRRCRWSAVASPRSPPARGRRGTAVRRRSRPRWEARWRGGKCSWKPVGGFRSWKAFCPQAQSGWESAGQWRRCWRSGFGLSPARWLRSSALSPPPCRPPACATRVSVSLRIRSNSAPSCRRSRCGSRRPRRSLWSPNRSSASPWAAAWQKSWCRVNSSKIRLSARGPNPNPGVVLTSPDGAEFNRGKAVVVKLGWPTLSQVSLRRLHWRWTQSSRSAGLL